MKDRPYFDEIIDYAIGREKDAVQFYRGLQESAPFSEKKKLLKDLEAMERGHITVLERLKKHGDEITVPDVQDLHISEYVLTAPPTGQMSYQDILITAMKREEASLKLYSDLAEKSMDGTVKKLFLKIASEEAKHKLMFEEIYDEEILAQG